MRIPYRNFIIVSLWVMAFFTILFALSQAWLLGNPLAILVGILAPMMAGISTGILIFANQQAKLASNNRLEELMSVMDDDERQAFKQVLKDRYLYQQEKSKRLTDGELPFDADDYFVGHNLSRD